MAASGETRRKLNSINYPLKSSKIILPSWVKLGVKLLVTTLCAFYISSKIDFKTTLSLSRTASPFWIIMAIFLFGVSKWIAAIRLEVYFKNINFYIPRKYNIMLYWLGMFYNLFLPGGIGGDAYKIILLHKTYNFPAKSLSSAIFFDRLSGVAALGILATILINFIFPSQILGFIAISVSIVSLLLFYQLVRKVFAAYLPGFYKTLWLGIIVQLLQVACVWSIIEALHIAQNQTEYILLFLVSSVIAILPFTIGGLGAREVVFLWGSNYFALHSETSISISLLFYLITVIVSATGLYWVFKNPLEPR